MLSRKHKDEREIPLQREFHPERLNLFPHNLENDLLKLEQS